MADKEAILATLNIKAMTFDDTFSALAKSKQTDLLWTVCYELENCLLLMLKLCDFLNCAIPSHFWSSKLFMITRLMHIKSHSRPE